MTFAQSLRTGVEALRANPLRTVLSTLGVIIGVASLVAVLAVGDGLEASIREQLETTTSVQFFNVVAETTEEVDGQQFPRDDYPVFSLDDVRDAARVPDVAALTGQVQGRAEARDTAGRVRRMVGVVATTEAQQAIQPVPIAAGRFLSAEDVADTLAPAVVVSHALAVRLASSVGGTGVDDAVGETLQLEGTRFTIVGVAADTASGAESAWVGLPLARRALAPSARPRPVLLIGKFAAIERSDSVRVAMQRWADARFGAGTTTLRSNEGRLAQATQGILAFKLFMGAITGISLLVGGIGIMNVLLASVSERTREIGIRKAVGARARDVRRQFLAESVAIAVAGSLLGIALGLTGAFSITAFMRAQLEGFQLHASVSWSTVAVAVGSAALTGLVFGTYPARRAARLDPIDAIRHE